MSIVLFAVSWLAHAQAPAATNGLAVTGTPVGDAGAGLQLIDVDAAVTVKFRDVLKAIEEKRYDEAAEAVHGIVSSSGSQTLFPRGDDKRRYAPVGLAATYFLGRLPPEVIEAYDRQYDSAARTLLDPARRDGDGAALRVVADRYFHTRHGGEAAALLAAAAFDESDFFEAATMWEMLGQNHRRVGKDRPMLLAKACVAYHMAGANEKAASLVERIRKEYPTAEVRVAKRQIAVLEFLEKALRTPPPAVGRRTPVSGPALPPAVVVTNRIGGALFPLWSTEEPEWRAATAGVSRIDEAGGATDVRTREGHVRVGRTRPGYAELRFDLSPSVHPVAIEGLVLCRRETAVVATTAESGLERWRTRDLPLYREGPGGERSARGLYFGIEGDMGRHALAVGDGRVYTVCKFRRIDPTDAAGATGAVTNDSSSLVALTVGSDSAGVAWEVGNGLGASPSVRRAKYLGAPTFHQGKLYAMARQGIRYFAMCLDAANGALLWETPLGVVPMLHDGAMTGRQTYTLELLTERASPPAVGEGMVFFVTNSGLVLGLRADTGSPVWAYRYDSTVSGSALESSMVDLLGHTTRVSAMRRPFPPVNAAVPIQGRVVCLPCDTSRILALHAKTGELLWQRDREGRQDLTALDDSTVLLSGPDLTLLRATDGNVQFRAGGGILGKPVIADGRLLASGEGCIVGIDLATRRVERFPVLLQDAILGTMAASGGKVLAANMAGCGAYADLDASLRYLGHEIERTQAPARKAALGICRGTMAVSAGRLGDAAQALTAAADAAAKSNDPAQAREANRLLSEVRVRQARDAAGEEEAGQYLKQAAECALATQEQVRVLQEQLRYHEQFGRSREAVACAQTLLEKYGDTWCTVSGTNITNSMRLGARALGSREVARLVARYGAESYTAFDEQANKAFDSAAAKEDPDAMSAVQARWPGATRAGEGLLRASEILFREATAGRRPDVDRAMKAYRLLDRARQDGRAETRARAAAGQAWINMRFRPNLAQTLATPLKTFDPALSGRFADFGGTVGDMVKRVGEMRQTPIAREDAEFADVGFPLRPVYAAEIGGASLLRDTRGAVVRLGDWVFLRLAGRLMCLDAQSDDYDGGARWTVEMPDVTAKSRLVGQLSADGGRLALLDDTNLLSVAACSGTVLYRRSLSSLGVGEWRHSAGAGDWLAILDKQKRAACVDTSAGTVVWQIAGDSLEGGFLSAQDEVLMLSGAQNRSQAVCFDARTGVTMSTFVLHGSWEHPPFAVLTLGGLAVYSEPGGKLGLRDVRLRSDPAPRRIDLGSEGWRVLGCGEGFLFAGKVAGDGAVHAVDLCATNRILRLELGSGRTCWPVQAFAADRRLLVLHAEKHAKGLLTDPALTAFDLPAATVAWTRRLAAENSGKWRIAEIGLYGDRMGITVVAGDRRQPCRQFVARIGDGNLFDCSAVLRGAGQNPVSAESPVVLNGRVLMVGEQGVACLAGREP